MISDYGPTLSFSSKSDSASDEGVFTTFFFDFYLEPFLLVGLFILLVRPDLGGDKSDSYSLISIS